MTETTSIEKAAPLSSVAAATTEPLGGLGPMALALSGGGFRAMAYHLGTMRALVALELLDDVRYLSTASGGSILGALWAVSLAEGRPFADFDKLVTEVLRRNIVGEALTRMRGGRSPPSLIQAAAAVYDQLFGGRRLSAFAEPGSLGPHLRHITINATHFSLGYGFRFTFPPRPDAPFGNRAVTIKPNGSGMESRLGDVVAASSCFPGGFEPLLFPSQFHWQGEVPKVSASGIDSGTTEEVIPLMDGGIHDNQAIEPLLLINQSAARPDSKTLGIGTLVCSDTDQKKMPYYTPRRVGMVLAIARRVPLGLFTLAAGLLMAEFASAGDRPAGFVTLWPVAGATLMGVVLAVVAVLVGVAQAKLPFSYPSLPVLLLRLSLGDIYLLVVNRGRSVLSLTQEVFMYRIRALGRRSVRKFRNLDRFVRRSTTGQFGDQLPPHAARAGGRHDHRALESPGRANQAGAAALQAPGAGAHADPFSAPPPT